MKKLYVTYHLSPSSVRGFCIERNFYTCGDCRAYEAMFEMCHRATSTDDIFRIAEDIFEHSDIELIMEDYGDVTELEALEYISRGLLQRADVMTEVMYMN